MFRNQPFIAEMFSIVIAVVLVVATVAFVSVPFALERHPWEAGAVAASDNSGTRT